MDEVIDGDLLKYVVKVVHILENIFWKYPETLELVSHMSDDELIKMKLGGHDPVKMYAAYKEATEHKGRPTVILARTIKGYGMGSAGEGRNITHNQKKLNEDELLYLEIGLVLNFQIKKRLRLHFLNQKQTAKK